MYFYHAGGYLAASLLPNLPLAHAQPPACGFPPLILVDRDPRNRPHRLRVSDPGSSLLPGRARSGWMRTVCPPPLRI